MWILKVKNQQLTSKKQQLVLKNQRLVTKNQRLKRKKAKIELDVEESSFNKTAKENLLKFVRGVELDEIFGVSRVREIVVCGASSASAALKKLQALDLIEPVVGHGKGKFRFKE
ncbi:MAG: hypothetical protein MJZ22_06175 [Candidatus Saccharibacteria bacterium]|nr:hypothetical protein [Candidatus Saccharibacteria bacterium]